MQQPMQNLEDSSDPITAMNMALGLLAKAFKVNTIPTNNNQRSLLIPHNSQIAQPDMNTSQDIKMKMVDDNVGNQLRHNAVQNDGNEVGQNAVYNLVIHIVKNMNGLSVVLEIANQYGNGNVVTTPAEGNGNGINGNPIRCYNCRGESHYASNCTIKLMKRDADYLQQQLQIAQEEEAGIQSTQEEFEFMAAADAYEETEKVKINCTLEDTLQQASISKTQFDNAPVYDLDGPTEAPKDEIFYDHDIFNMLTHEKPEDENVSLEFQVLCYAKENAHLKTTYKNMFDFINVSKTKGTTKGTRMNAMFTKQSILRKPPSSSFKPKLNSVTPFPKSSVLPKVDKTNALSKPVTSNSAPSIRELKVVQTVNVISPRIFRTNPSKTSRVDNVVPNKPVKTSVRIKPITVLQLNVINKQQANSELNGFSSTRVNNTAKTRRPHPKSNSNIDRVPSKSKSSCPSNNVKKIEENHMNSQIPKNQKHMSSECNNIMLAIQYAKSEIVCVMVVVVDEDDSDDSFGGDDMVMMLVMMVVGVGGSHGGDGGVVTMVWR
uniref:CCHC-type domain-containing protein n=1 Tax=Tanacetum cinerariifolium TaxID=118510 RepID=A0A6L2N9F1_TANCI|nr:hypothetical protein [Tanacetum cinerariifolium]